MKKILYFSASWCGPCKQLGPVMDKLNSEGINIQKIDVDNNQGPSITYSVRNIPCLILVDGGGNEIKRLVGNQTANNIKNWYNN
jgi:thioredoxin 1